MAFLYRHCISTSSKAHKQRGDDNSARFVYADFHPCGIQAFSYFWNTWASTRKGLKVIVCGSSTSWMLDKVIGDKGGLYGRTSRSIYLAPFTLYETEQFLVHNKGIQWSRFQIVEAYM